MILEISGYINQSLKNGLSRDQITTELKKVGWQDSQINEAFTQNQSLAPQTVQNNPLNKKGGALAFLISFAVLSVTFYLTIFPIFRVINFALGLPHGWIELSILGNPFISVYAVVVILAIVLSSIIYKITSIFFPNKRLQATLIAAFILVILSFILVLIDINFIPKQSFIPTI